MKYEIYLEFEYFAQTKMPQIIAHFRKKLFEADMLNS